MPYNSTPSIFPQVAWPILINTEGAPSVLEALCGTCWGTERCLTCLRPQAAVTLPQEETVAEGGRGVWLSPTGFLASAIALGRSKTRNTGLISLEMG